MEPKNPKSNPKIDILTLRATWIFGSYILEVSGEFRLPSKHKHLACTLTMNPSTLINSYPVPSVTSMELDLALHRDAPPSQLTTREKIANTEETLKTINELTRDLLDNMLDALERSALNPSPMMNLVSFRNFVRHQFLHPELSRRIWEFLNRHFADLLAILHVNYDGLAHLLYKYAHIIASEYLMERRAHDDANMTMPVVSDPVGSGSETETDDEAETLPHIDDQYNPLVRSYYRADRPVYESREDEAEPSGPQAHVAVAVSHDQVDLEPEQAHEAMFATPPPRSTIVPPAVVSRSPVTPVVQAPLNRLVFEISSDDEADDETSYITPVNTRARSPRVCPSPQRKRARRDDAINNPQPRFEEDE